MRSIETTKRGRVIEEILRALWPSEHHDAAVLSEHALLSACSDAHIERLVQWVLRRLPFLPAHSRKKIELVLSLLSTRLGTFLLVGFQCFTHRPPFMTEFWNLPLLRIGNILRHWLNHRIPLLRLLGRGLKGICLQALVSMPGVEQPGLNEWAAPTLSTAGYTARPAPTPLQPPESATEAAIQSCLLSLNAPSGAVYSCSGLAELVARLEARGLKACLASAATPENTAWLPKPWRNKLNTATPAATSSLSANQRRRTHDDVIDAIVEVDVLVIGSGAGGGVTASVLAEAGLRVLVVEKGAYMHPEDIPRADDEALLAAYEHGLLTSTSDSGISVLAGSGLGGGTRINWCASFRTPPHVRREWQHQHGLQFANTPRFTRALDVICDKLSVHCQPNSEADMSAVALQRGMHKLDSHIDVIPQNCVKPDQCVKHCCFGCISGGKQDTATAFVAPAVATGNLTIITHASAHQILTERCTAATPGGAKAGASASPPSEQQRRRQRRAVGAIIRLEGGSTLGAAGSSSIKAAAPRTIVVRARVVVAAAGSLHSPALLLRSGVKCGGNVGKHLRLHPATFVVGAPALLGETKTPATPKTLSEEMQAPQMPLYSRAAAHWPPLPHTVNGSDQDTAAVVTGGDVSNPPNVFRDMHDMHASDGLTGYGTFLSTGTNVPVIVAPGVPFVDRFQMHRDVTGMQGMVHVLQYTRDEGPGGHVKLNGEGQPELFYKLSKATEKNVLEGMMLSLRALRASGAQRMLTLHDSYTEYTGGHDSSGQEDSDACFEEWLRGVEKKGGGPHQLQLFSAHQLGTCRMGADSKTSVVDTRGECWDVEGLWVADASLLPTSTGVNPMVTTEAMALCVAETLASELLGTPFELVPKDVALCSSKFEW